MAASYDDYNYPRYWQKRAYEHASEVIALTNFFEIIGSKKKILDIGAGYGRLLPVYRSYSKHITLADPSRQLLAKAKVSFGANKDVHFVRSTLVNLPEKLSGKKFDVVLLVRVMHHIKDPAVAIKTVSQLLPKGGYFILEFANKLHGKAVLKNFLSGNFTFPLDIFPLDKRSKRNIKKNSILFLNHHPDTVYECLKTYGFRVIGKRSVSNIRSRRIKRIAPLFMLTAFEKLAQKPLSRINFGPSVFILAKKI